MTDLEASRVNIYLHAENVRLFNNHERPVLPTCLVTGFLGAGKTTLLKHILENRSNLRIAAAINDFAQLNIDENLIKAKQTASKVVELSNGCVCCHLLDDLKDAVFQMLDNNGDVDADNVNYLLVETSGVSDPSTVIRALDAKFGPCFRARLDSVVTVVDADQIMISEANSSNNTHRTSPTAMLQQLACADVILMNKMDLLQNDEEANLVEERLEKYNPNATIYRTKHCNVPLSWILDVESPPLTDCTSEGNAITHEATAVPIYASATGGALRSISASKNNKSLAPSGDMSALTFHLKRDKFDSVAVSLDSHPLSLAKLQAFVCSDLVQGLSRMKGVLWIRGFRERCVLHLSGRGRIGFELDGQWSGPPVSEIAFIGSGIDADELRRGFVGCSSECDEQETTDSVGLQDSGLTVLENLKEFQIISIDPETAGINKELVYFRLSASELYGYTEEQIERDLRIDTNAMQMALADGVNASVNEKVKAFITYQRAKTASGTTNVMLCCPRYAFSVPANNLEVLQREANAVLKNYFRNVQTCKCGA